MRDHGQVVAHHHETQAAQLAQGFQQVQHFGLHAGVQRRGGLIQQQHLRLQDERPRNGYTLTLAAAQLVRVAEAETTAQTDIVQGAFDALLCVVKAVDGQRLGQDAVDCLAWVQAAIRVLEDHLHLAAEGLAAGLGQTAIARERDGAAGTPVQAADGAQHRALAAAAFADDAKALARGDAEAHVIHGGEAVEDHAQALDAEADHFGSSAPSCAHSGWRSSVGSGWRAAPSSGRQLSRPRV